MTHLTAARTRRQRATRFTLAIGTAALLVTALFQPASAATAPTLNTVASFAVLAGTTVTNTGPTIITGDLGVHPGLAITGFPPGVVVGTKLSGGPVALQAKNDLVTAYNDIDLQPCVTTYPDAFDLVGLTLSPGVYCSPSSLFLSGTLTLDAQFDPNAVWIFQAETSTLITGSASTVRIINGGRDCNVYWKVGSSATLGSNSTFVGNILALSSISMNTGATVSGRALARNGAVTLQSNKVNMTACTSPVDTPPTETAALSLSKTSDRTTYTTAGDLITYTYIVKNTGNVLLTGPFTVTDDRINGGAPFVCGSGSLAVGATLTCNMTYVVQPSDLGDAASSFAQGTTATINTGAWLSFANSTQDTRISSAGPDVKSGTYACWCIQDHVPTDLHNQPAKLYSTIGAGLPADVASLAWGKVNYTLNHKIRASGRTNLDFLKDVQTAIWVLTGEQNPEFGMSAPARQMINEANAHPGFVPLSGEIAATIIYSDGMTIKRNSIQESICEMRSSLKSIVNKAKASAGTVVSSQVQVTVKQVR